MMKFMSNKVIFVVFVFCITATGYSIEIKDKDRIGYINDFYQIKSATIIAKSNMGMGLYKPMLVRSHLTESRAAEFIYDKSNADLVEANLNDLVDFSNISRKGDNQVTQYLISNNHSECYEVGGGANQLDIWDRKYYGIRDYMEYSGVGFEHALLKRWPENKYIISKEGFEEESITEEGLLHGAYVIKYKNDPDKIRYRHEIYSGNGADGPFNRIEYYGEDGSLEKTIKNSDFSDESGISFPKKIEIQKGHDGVKELHEIKKVVINPELDARLFESPKVNPGGQVFIHRLVNGKDDIMEYQIPTLNEELSYLFLDTQVSDQAEDAKSSDAKVQTPIQVCEHKHHITANESENGLDNITEPEKKVSRFYQKLFFALLAVFFMIFAALHLIKRKVKNA